MEVVVAKAQLVPPAALRTFFFFPVLKPDFSDMLTTTLDFDADEVVVPGVHPVVGLTVIPVQLASPPFYSSFGRLSKILLPIFIYYIT